MCHCHACQQRTGSAFGFQARFADDKVQIEGRSTVYVRTADSGNRISFHFCPECGSTVFYRLDALPGFTVITGGALAGEPLPTPTVSVYESRRLPWVVLPPGAEHLD